MSIGSLGFVLVGGIVTVAVNTATTVVVAVLLIRGPRRTDALMRTRLLLLGALGTAILSGVAVLAYRLATGDAPPHPWLSDAISICYVPLTVVGLLLIPSSSRRAGVRPRAVADGALAASSLWYLLLAVGVAGHLRQLGEGLWAQAITLAYPIGDVFVVSTALVVIAYCAMPAQRMVRWIALGLSLVAAQDIWSALSGQDRRIATVVLPLMFQLGLLLLALAAARPAVSAIADAAEPNRSARLLGALPFLPLAACVVATTRMVVIGAGMPSAQVLPALLVAVALMARQWTSSHDKLRLVSQLLRREQELEGALRLDDLTGLANRVGFIERLQRALAAPDQWPVTLAVLDLNDFKLINDNHGHHVGDEMLQQVARRLRQTVRGGDMVVRLGGDEFAVLTTGSWGGAGDSLGRRLLTCFDSPVTVDGRRFEMTVSVGIVTARPDDNAAALLAHADAAMYQAKERKDRGSHVEVLGADNRHSTVRRLRIREDIGSPAFQDFFVAYQPVVDLATGRIRGMEALMRWRHPELGLIPPDEFIPLAEQAGTIGVLGERVLDTAVADLARLAAIRPHHRLAIGVNVSPRQLTDPTFVEHVLGLIRLHGLTPDQLVLEVTEQAFEADLTSVAATVDALATAGVSVAVDDFGTGYSSLRYLQHLRLEVMKIDRSFVAEIPSVRGSQLVSSIATMGTALGLQLVAEGIENLDQLRVLQSFNCELGQGYLFSPPVPIEEFEQLITTGHVYPLGDGDAAPLVPTPRPAAA